MPKASALRDSVAVRRGQKVRATQFHYSRWIRPRTSAAYGFTRTTKVYARGNIHAPISIFTSAARRNVLARLSKALPMENPGMPQMPRPSSGLLVLACRPK